MTVPVVQSCREELETLLREGREPALAARLQQLLSLLDFTTRLGWTARGDEIPDAVLGFVMGELEAGCGVLYMAAGERGFERRAAIGNPSALLRVQEVEGDGVDAELRKRRRERGHERAVLTRTGTMSEDQRGVEPRLGGAIDERRHLRIAVDADWQLTATDHGVLASRRRFSARC